LQGKTPHSNKHSGTLKNLVMSPKRGLKPRYTHRHLVATLLGRRLQPSMQDLCPQRRDKKEECRCLDVRRSLVRSSSIACLNAITAIHTSTLKVRERCSSETSASVFKTASVTNQKTKVSAVTVVKTSKRVTEMLYLSVIFITFAGTQTRRKHYHIPTSQ
jgi:hypothetical protein